MTNAFDYDNIKCLLDETQCPYRLYPARIKALNIFLGQNFEFEIQRQVITGIADHIFEKGWVNQFLRDLDTFGLYEAILYFHTYPFPTGAENFIHKACSLYHTIALQYMTHHLSIISSDDPRIQAQLEIIRNSGSGTQHVSRLQMPSRTRPEIIALPAKPPSESGYQRKLPLSNDMKELYRWSGMGSTEGPGNIADELIEQLFAQFTFEDFPGLQIVFFEIADLLQIFEIDPFSSTGQYVLEAIIEYMGEDLFGDFMRWIECVVCGKEFMPEISLQSANENLIYGGWVCMKCQPSNGD